VDDSRSIPSSHQPNSGTPNNSDFHAGSDETRDGLLIRLIFASRRLAQSRLQVTPVPAHTEAVCRECGAFGALPTHGKHCKTGLVLGIIDELMALTPAGLGDDKAVRA
jgi:hypothetical protein